jgi:nucleotide-binding universal stress UspA family protein
VSYLIVVGVDGSDNATHALRWAGEEAQLRGGSVTALLAWQFPLIGIPGAFDPQELEGNAKQSLVSQVAEAGLPEGIEVNQIVAQGDPGASLIHSCDQLEADLLVLGARHRGGFAGVAMDAVSGVACPVVIVKPLSGDANDGADASTTANSAQAPAA